jgi:hypothetical protein
LFVGSPDEYAQQSRELVAGGSGVSMHVQEHTRGSVRSRDAESGDESEPDDARKAKRVRGSVEQAEQPNIERRSTRGTSGASKVQAQPILPRDSKPKRRIHKRTE